MEEVSIVDLPQDLREKIEDRINSYNEYLLKADIITKYYYPTKFFNSFIEYLVFIAENHKDLDYYNNRLFPNDVVVNMIIAYIHPRSVYDKTLLRMLFKEIYDKDISELENVGNMLLEWYEKMNNQGIYENIDEWCEVDDLFPPYYEIFKRIYITKEVLENNYIISDNAQKHSYFIVDKSKLI